MDPLNPITYFAETDARNKKIKFGIKAKDRLKHMYIIGKTGMGKSTLLENLAIQDIQNGEGLAFLDPHGGTAEKLLEYVPEHRIKDVVYFAPFDMEYPVSFNIMEDVGPDKRHLVVNGLMATFEKIWEDAWSARMAYILQNTLLALLEYPGATLLAVNRMYTDKEFRKKVVDNVTDISVKSFWVDEYAKYTDKYAAEATPAIQNKVGQFAGNPLIRNIIGQSKSSFDIRKIMDERKILIVNMSKGRVGEGNANLLGSMLITKIYLAAMSRADLTASDIAKAPNFYLYVDEFQSFANKSFADILSEARKYKLNLTIAHQYIEQMEEEVRDAVFGNVGTMITFRVGAYDAEVLEKEFAPIFTAEDLVNLGFIQIYLKLMIDGVASQPFSATSMAPIPLPAVTFKDQVVETSRAAFAHGRADVEAEIMRFHEESRQPVAQPGQNMGMNRPQPSQNTGQNMSQNFVRAPLGPERELPRPVEKQDKPQFTAPVQSVQPPRSFEQKPEIKPEFKLEPKEDPNKAAFAEAARLLSQKQQQVVAQGQVQKPAQQPQPQLQTQNKISLNDLKPEHEKAKMPTQENMSSLKSALAGVLSKPPEVKKPEPIKVPEKEIQKPAPVQHIKSEASIAVSGVKEVPEEVLRKLLEVEEPKQVKA